MSRNVSRLKRRCGRREGRVRTGKWRRQGCVLEGLVSHLGRCQAHQVGSRRAAVPPSARWLLKESSRQPAYSPDGRLRPGLNVLEPGQWLLKDEDDAEVIAMKRAVLDDPQVGQSLWVSDGQASTVAAEEELYSLVAASQPGPGAHSEPTSDHGSSTACQGRPHTVATARRHSCYDVLCMRLLFLWPTADQAWCPPCRYTLSGSLGMQRACADLWIGSLPNSDPTRVSGEPISSSDGLGSCCIPPHAAIRA